LKTNVFHTGRLGRIGLLITCCLCSWFTASGQKTIPLAKWRQAFNPKGDTASSAAVDYLMSEYWYFHNDSLRKYIPFFLRQAERYNRKNDGLSEFRMLYLVGYAQKFLNNPTQSAEYYFRALKLADKLEDQVLRNRVYRELGDSLLSAIKLAKGDSIFRKGHGVLWHPG
jgi:hypothetical protein